MVGSRVRQSSPRRTSFAGLLAPALVALFPTLDVACSPPPGPTPPPAPSASASVVAALASAPPPARPDAGLGAPSDDEAIEKAQAEYLELLVAGSPELATALGIHTRDAELDPRDPAGWEAVLGREEAMLRSLEQRFAAPRASRRARTDLELMKHQLRVDVRRKRAERHLERRPDLYASPMNAIFLMTARDYAPADERAKNILARVEKIPAMLDHAKQNLKSPPKVWTQVGVEQAGSAKAFFEEQRAFLHKALPGDKARVDKALAAAVDAYAKYKQFLERVVMPRSNGEFAAGRELFDFLLHEDYFLAEDADGVRAIGQRVFDKTRGEMDALAKKIDPKAKGFPEVLAKLKGNHPTAEGLIPAYQREVERAKRFLVDKDVVPFPPGDDLSIIETPVFQRSTVTAAYDQPPPFDKVTKGFFFVTPVDKSLPKAKQEAMLRENDHGDIVDTSVHEAYPGHHLQLSFARLHPSTARKVTDAAIFSEGWALYSEELMAELGYYTPEERMLQLEWTLVRAARVVIDVGLHTKGMTFDEAVKILTDQVHLERPLAESEVKRYTLNATQPLAYLTGREMIFKLRDRVKARDGASFSLKKFHGEVLSHGTISPGLIEKEMFEE